MSKGDILSQLARVEVLRELPAPSLRALAAHCHIQELAKGRVVYLCGDPPALCAVLHGRVAVVAQPSAGCEVELFMRHAQRVFGEVSLIVGHQLYQARAVERSLIARLSGDVAHAAVRQCRAAADAIDTLMAARLAEAEARLAAAAALSVKERLADLLVRLAACDGMSDSGGMRLRDRLTHEELGRMLGANRVSVTRAVSELREEGRVAVCNARLVLVRPRG